MRVMIDITSTLGTVTGIGRYTQQLLEHLPKIAPKYRFDVHPNPWLFRFRQYCKRMCVPKDPASPPASLHRKLFSPRRWFLRSLKQLNHFLPPIYSRYFLSRLRFDLYHETNYIPIACGIPTVTTFHDLSIIHHPEWHPKERVDWFEKHLPRSYSQSRHFITDTESVRQEMIRDLGIPAEKITRVWCGIRSDLERLSPEECAPVLERLNLPSSFLLHVGTIEPRKNLHLLMKAYSDLPNSLRDRCPLVLVGQWGWNYTQAAEYFQSTGKHKNIRQIGYVSDADLPALYSSARSLVFPTHYEGFGIPPLEMMGCGGAVIASTADSVREMTGGFAPLIEPLDLAGWRDALQKAIVEDDWIAMLREGVVEHARQFTWERTAVETLQVYHQVLGAKKAAPPLRKAA